MENMPKPYEKNPQKEALEKKRDEYIKKAINEVFEKPELSQKANNLFTKKDSGETIIDSLVKTVLDELKEQYGITNKSSEKTINEFLEENPIEVIKEILLQDSRIIKRDSADGETTKYEIKDLGNFGYNKKEYNIE